MTLAMLFWVLYIISIVFAFWGVYEPAQPAWYRRAGGYLIFWILIGILGWRVFGPAIRS